MFSRKTRLVPNILTIHHRNINTLQEALRVLKLESSTSIDVAAIKNSYYDLSKELHPDKNVGKDTTAAFNKLNLAYQFCVEHAQNNLFNSPHRQKPADNPRAPRPVSFRKGFGQRTAYTGETLKKTMTYTPEEKRGSQTKEAAKDTRWVPREGLPKSQTREVPKSTFGLTDKHKYVKMDKGTVDLRRPKPLPKWKDGNTFFDEYTKNFDE
jgi:hypothetical protein